MAGPVKSVEYDSVKSSERGMVPINLVFINGGTEIGSATRGDGNNPGRGKGSCFTNKDI